MRLLTAVWNVFFLGRIYKRKKGISYNLFFLLVDSVVVILVSFLLSWLLPCFHIFLNLTYFLVRKRISFFLNNFLFQPLFTFRSLPSAVIISYSRLICSQRPYLWLEHTLSGAASSDAYTYSRLRLIVSDAYFMNHKEMHTYNFFQEKHFLFRIKYDSEKATWRSKYPS